MFEVTPEYRRSRLWIDDKTYIQKTEYLGEDLLIAYNQHRLNESQTQRFGDGKVVASIPMNILYGSNSEVAKKLKEGDSDHLKWWLDSEAGRPWRRFRGRLT